MKLSKKQIIKLIKAGVTTKSISLESGVSKKRIEKLIKEVKDANRHTKRIL